VTFRDRVVTASAVFNKAFSLPFLGVRLGVRQNIRKAILPAVSGETAETAFSERRMTLVTKDAIVKLWKNVQL
jgi:hypothetical protein